MTVTEAGTITKSFRKPFPRLWPSVGWAVLYLVMQLVIGGVAIAAVFVPLAMHDHALAQHMPQGMKGMFAIPGFAYAVYASVILPAGIMLFIFWQILKRDGRAERIGLFAPSRLSLGKTVGLGIALLVFGIAIEAFYSTYIYTAKDAQEFTRLLILALPNSVPNLLIKLLAVVVAGPLVEEVLFRGYLQNALKAKLPTHMAMVFTALIFAVYHMQPAAIPTLTVIGLAIGYFYHYTGSLKWSMALHMLNNSVALIATLYGAN